MLLAGLGERGLQDACAVGFGVGELSASRSPIIAQYSGSSTQFAPAAAAWATSFCMAAMLSAMRGVLVSWMAARVRVVMRGTRVIRQPEWD